MRRKSRNQKNKGNINLTKDKIGKRSKKEKIKKKEREDMTQLKILKETKLNPRRALMEIS